MFSCIFSTDDQPCGCSKTSRTFRNNLVGLVDNSVTPIPTKRNHGATNVVMVEAIEYLFRNPVLWKMFVQVMTRIIPVETFNDLHHTVDNFQ